MPWPDNTEDWLNLLGGDPTDPTKPKLPSPGAAMSMVTPGLGPSVPFGMPSPNRPMTHAEIAESIRRQNDAAKVEQQLADASVRTRALQFALTFGRAAKGTLEAAQRYNPMSPAGMIHAAQDAPAMAKAVQSLPEYISQLPMRLRMRDPALLANVGMAAAPTAASKIAGDLPGILSSETGAFGPITKAHAARVADQLGGATLDPEMLMPTQRSGYAVANPFLTRVIKPGEDKLEVIHQFLQDPEVARALQHPDAHIGTYTNPDGSSELNVTRLHDDKDLAMELGRQGGQYGIGRLRYGDYKGTIETPQDPTVVEHRTPHDIGGVVRPGAGPRGPVKGAELARQASHPDLYLPRSYFTAEGGTPEAGFENLPAYRGTLSKVYNLDEDPFDVRGIAERRAQSMGVYGPGVASVMEGLIKDAGFEGYRSGHTVAAFHDVPVERITPELRFDPEHGLGAVPSNANIDYEGFVTSIKPSEFLGLNPARESGPSKFISDQLRSGRPMGPPFLLAKWDPERLAWQVVGHEGRGRVQAILEQYGDKEIPVHVLPSGMRARHVTPEMRSSPFHSDERAATPRRVVPPISVTRASQEQWPAPFETGETRPLMTPSGDYILYHGTSKQNIPSINAEGLRPDNIGKVGFTTHPADAGMFGAMKYGRENRTILETVVDGNWLRSQRITREGDHPGMWLVNQPVPRSAIKQIRPYDDWESAIQDRPEAAREATPERTPMDSLPGLSALRPATGPASPLGTLSKDDLTQHAYAWAHYSRVANTPEEFAAAVTRDYPQYAGVLRGKTLDQVWRRVKTHQEFVRSMPSPDQAVADAHANPDIAMRDWYHEEKGMMEPAVGPELTDRHQRFGAVLSPQTTPADEVYSSLHALQQHIRGEPLTFESMSPYHRKLTRTQALKLATQQGEGPWAAPTKSAGGAAIKTSPYYLTRKGIGDLAVVDQHMAKYYTGQNLQDLTPAQKHVVAGRIMADAERAGMSVKQFQASIWGHQAGYSGAFGMEGASPADWIRFHLASGEFNDLLQRFPKLNDIAEQGRRGILDIPADRRAKLLERYPNHEALQEMKDVPDEGSSISPADTLLLPPPMTAGARGPLVDADLIGGPRDGERVQIQSHRAELPIIGRKARETAGGEQAVDPTDVGSRMRVGRYVRKPGTREYHWEGWR